MLEREKLHEKTLTEGKTQAVHRCLGLLDSNLDASTFTSDVEFPIRFLHSRHDISDSLTAVSE